MNFYYFGHGSDIETLIENKFSGILFTYNARQSDHFTFSARHLNKDNDFKYMVAVRPYAISPQYLSMIFRSFNEIKPNSLQVNLISGYIKDDEKGYGGIIGEVNDFSSKVDRSNYLIKYIHMLNHLNKQEENITEGDFIDFYISATNEFVFTEGAENKNNMIVPYSNYKNTVFKIGQPEKIMLSMGPIIRETQDDLNEAHKETKEFKTNDTEYFTKEQLTKVLDELSYRGINEVLFFAWPEEEKENIFNFINEYQTNKKEIK
jgi:hypothetical protein